MTVILIRDLALLLLLWGALGALLIGMGRLLLRIGIGARSELTPLEQLWLGFVVAVLLLQAWCLVRAVTLLAWAPLATLSALGWFLSPVSVRPDGPKLRSTNAFGTFLAVLWLAGRSLGPNDSFDSATYQIPFIEWLTKFPVAPGLANLEPRFGFNSAILPFHALIESILPGRSFHVVNGFLAASFAALLLSWLATPRRSTTAGLIAAGLLPSVFFFGLGRSSISLASTSTDIPVALVLFLGWAFMTRGAELKDSRTLDSTALELGFSAVCLLGIVPALKASGIAFAGASLLLIGALWFKDLRRVPRRTVIAGLAVVILAVGMWCASNAIISGYLLFPSGIFRLDRDWTLPSQHQEFHAWWIREFARMPYPAEAHGAAAHSWPLYWLLYVARKAKFELWLPLAMVISAVILRPRRDAATARPQNKIVLFAPTVLALVLWSWSAPGIRFGFALAWILALQVLDFMVFSRIDKRQFGQTVLVLLVSLLTATFVLDMASGLRQRNETPLQALASEIAPTRGETVGLLPAPSPRLVRVFACGGTLPVATRPPGLSSAELFVSWREHSPWYTPPPATYNVLPGLCPRDSSEIRRGFRIDERDTAANQPLRDRIASLRSRNATLRTIVEETSLTPRRIEEIMAPRTE